MNEIFKEEKIKLKDLKLWSQNPRFPQKYIGKNDDVLIDYIVSVSHYQIANFGDEIVNDFDMPMFEKFAVYRQGNSNIAVEGNRRLTVYKLLADPTLTTNTIIRDHFSELKKKINISGDFEVDCVSSTNNEQALRYVERKHLKNNNEIAWGDLERTNAKLIWLSSTSKKDQFKSNISLIVQNLEIPERDKEDILGRGFVSSFFRIIESTSTAKFFNFRFTEENDLIYNNDFLGKLKIIIADILAKREYNQKKFSRLNTLEIEEYLKTIQLNSIEKNLPKNGNNNPIHNENSNKNINSTENAFEENLFVKNEENINTDVEKNSQPKTFLSNSNTHSENSSGATDPSNDQKDNSKSTIRKYLIPSTCKISINEPKINNIFRELKNDLILDDTKKATPNAAGVLFRVFLEVSLDHYAKKFGKEFKISDNIPVKINYAVTKLKENGYTDKKIFEYINTVGSTNKMQSYLSIEKFHQYVHSSTVQPSPSELKIKWDNLELFFKTLWADINKKTK